MRAHHKHYVVPSALPLFEQGLPAPPILIHATVLAPSVAVDTSREAAARIRPHTARVREAIYLYIRACGGATAGEIATSCGLNPSTVRPRLLELQGKAKWARGLPARIQRSPEVRKHMHVYRAL